jgi:hypothetical protein
MHKASIIGIAIVVGFSVVTSSMLITSAWAEDKVTEGKDATKGSGKSLMETTEKLKSDAGQTKDAAKALDLEKTKKGAGDVKEDVKDLKGSAKDMMTSPLGK